MGINGPVEISDLDYALHFDDPVPEEPDIPAAGEWPYSFFWKLNSRRRPGFEGISPIAYSEIRNWSELTRTFISPEDVELIICVDDAYLSALAEGRERKRRIEEARSKARESARKLMGNR